VLAPHRGRWTAGRWWGLALAVTVLAGCATGAMSSPIRAGGAPPPPRLTDQELAGGRGHACNVGGGGRPVVDWSRLRNPILQDRSGGTKDQALIWTRGSWHMLFSDVTSDASMPDGVRWGIATATSPDLVHWSDPTPWPRQNGVLGVASPDIVRDPSGRFLVTYQSDPGASDPASTQARLYYRTSADLAAWSPPHPLAWSLARSPQDRMIDGALVSSGHQLLLGYKFSSPSQPAVFELARSTSGGPQGPWQPVGRPDIAVNNGTVENYEFLSVAGAWRLVATSNNLDQPWLFNLAGDPGTAAGWLHWSSGYRLEVPSEPFNTGSGPSSVGYEHANSAYLCDASSLPGHFYYLLYAGSNELTQFGGWGHAKIGVARSTDLVHWHVPPG
jgi:hypothetical protein